MGGKRTLRNKKADLCGGVRSTWASVMHHISSIVRPGFGDGGTDKKGRKLSWRRDLKMLRFSLGASRTDRIRQLGDKVRGKAEVVWTCAEEGEGCSSWACRQEEMVQRAGVIEDDVYNVRHDSFISGFSPKETSETGPSLNFMHQQKPHKTKGHRAPFVLSAFCFWSSFFSSQFWCDSWPWPSWTCGCCSLWSTTRDTAAAPRKKTEYLMLDPGDHSELGHVRPSRCCKRRETAESTRSHSTLF